MRFSAWDGISVADACGKTRDQANMACRLYVSAQNDSTARHYLVNRHRFGGSECLTCSATVVIAWYNPFSWNLSSSIARIRGRVTPCRAARGRGFGFIQN